MEERKYDVDEISEIVKRSVEQTLKAMNLASHLDNDI